jgi:hypothetical protein
MTILIMKSQNKKYQKRIDNMNDSINKIIDDLDSIYTKLSIEENKYSEEINNLRNRLIK